MKKILAIVMMSLMMVTAAACGEKTDDNPTPETPGVETPEDEAGSEAEEKTLKIAGLDGGYETEHWKKLAEKFEESHDGVTVELTFEKNIEEV